MRLFLRFVVAVLLVAPVNAQLAIQEGTATELKAFPVVSFAPDAVEIAAGTVGYLWLGSHDPAHVLAAAFGWAASAPGEFQLAEEGLMLFGAISGGGSLYGAYAIPPELAGMMITLKPYATDGLTIDAGAVLTLRFV